jgi:hypothetical protein
MMHGMNYVDPGVPSYVEISLSQSSTGEKFRTKKTLLNPGSSSWNGRTNSQVKLDDCGIDWSARRLDGIHPGLLGCRFLVNL